MLVTLQLVAVDSSTQPIEISSALDLSPANDDGSEMADAVAARARDATLFLLKQIPEFGVQRNGFVPLVETLPKA